MYSNLYAGQCLDGLAQLFMRRPVCQVLGHFGHRHFGHGRFGQDISATDTSATDISANGHFGHGKNTYFLLLQMEFNRLLPFKITI